MKKILCSLALASVATLSITPAISSCGKNEKYTNEVKSVVNKLVEMDKYPRCTSIGQRSNLDAIRVWIIKEAIESNISYADIHSDEYGNIWFDVKPSEGYENSEPLILQGHMDMVVAGLTEELKATTPIDVEVDWNKGIVHSKDYKTSIGADDGVSLAIIFTLLQDPDFKHGWLRIIFTADEDSGMIGAADLVQNYAYIIQNVGPYQTGAPIKYILNIDAEGVGEVYRSCFGSDTYTFSSKTIEPSTEQMFENHLCLDVKGLKGGHSGGDIGLKRANAEKVIYEILNEINSDKNFQIIKHYHPDDKGDDISYQRNQIVPHAQLLFNSKLTAQQIQETIDKKITKWKTVYTGEDWNNVKITISSMKDGQQYNKFLTTNDSSLIIQKIGGNNNPTWMEEDGNLWYGSYSNIKGEVLKSANISPVEIEYENNDRFSVKVVCQFRTKTNDTLDEMINYYDKISLFKTTTASFYPAWEYHGQDNKLIDMVVDAYEYQSIQPKIIDSTGGMEDTHWANCNQDAHITSIGPTIEDAHSVKETLHIDSILPVYKTVKYICGQMKK